ncbi:hypothetical protein LJR118_006647 [Acidovorax sp. LjRoot118]|uniref:hypothetical protein n=1 Tax=Acidovorax sp. LjRoot118 TaxID=3342256 RepID=UPI003ED0DC54
MKFIASTFRALALAASVALVALSAISGPVVVTPGSNSGYLYFPPAAAGGGQAAPAAQGVGGVTYYNSQPALNVTVTAPQSPGSSCPPGCKTVNFSTGAGFAKLVATRPTRWTDNGGNVYPNCEAVLECQVWVNTNTSIIVRGYPVCFEPEIAENHAATCSTSSGNGGNSVYSITLQRIGYFILVGGSPRTIVPTGRYAAYGCYGIPLGANSTTDGKFNTDKIMAASCNTPASAASICANMSPAGTWYLPTNQELGAVNMNMVPTGGTNHWSSQEAGNDYAYNWRYDPEGSGYSMLQRSFTGYVVSCVKKY